MGSLKGVEVVKLTLLNTCFPTLKEDGCTRKTVEPTVIFGVNKKIKCPTNIVLQKAWAGNTFSDL